MTKCKGKSKEIAVSTYEKKAADAWDQAWGIYTDTEGWVEESKHNTEKGGVCSKKIRGVGKVFKLEALVEASPEEVFDVLVNGVCDWPKWNPAILECQHVQTINENTKISYSAGAPQLGGLVASRDFVNIIHWKSCDNIIMSAACAVTHPDMPTFKNHVRAENNPASYTFKPVPGKPNQCQFACILNTDLKGWLPQFLIDQAMSAVLLEYLQHLKNYLAEQQKIKQRQEEDSAQR